MSGQVNTLVGQALDGFTVKEYFEIFTVDLDNERVFSHGHDPDGCFIKDELLAKALLQDKGEPSCWHPADREHLKIEKVLLYTDGARYFLDPFTKVYPAEEEALRKTLAKRALEKLSPTTRWLLNV